MASPPAAFAGGRILTMEPGTPEPEVLVVEGDRIAAVGRREILRRFPDAEVHHLRGRTLCPGFIDAHHHLSIAALHPRWADARAVRDVEGLGGALRVHAARHGDTPWVRASGWSDIGTGFVPHRRQLDDLGLDRPILVAHYSLHQGVTDSRGLDELGIGASTPDPPGGDHRQRPGRDAQRPARRAGVVRCAPAVARPLRRPGPMGRSHRDRRHRSAG